MTPQIAMTLAIVAGALALFATERLRVDVIALLVLLTVAITGLVGPEEVFAGFSNPAVITVWAVYIVSGGLFKTGVADMMGQFILRLAGPSEGRLIAVVMLTCGTMSAFMNNVGATAMLLPAMVAISRRTKVPVSHLLIPLSFSSLMGGNMTLIGTPANILASNILADRGLATFALFDFFPTGAVVFATGVLYMVLVGRRLLPTRKSPEEWQVTGQLREYVSEVRLLPDSPLAGQTLIESRLGADYDLTVIAIVREGEVRPALHRDTLLEPDDLMMIEGSVENLIRARDAFGFVIEAEQIVELAKLDPEQVHLVEATLAPQSPMVDRTLREMQFRDRYGFTALAIWRHGDVITQRLRDVRLRFGDALLLQGPSHRLPTLGEGNEFLVLEPVTLELRRRSKAPIAVASLALVLGLVILADYHISTAMVIGSVLMVLAGCLTMDEAYQSIDSSRDPAGRAEPWRRHRRRGVAAAHSGPAGSVLAAGSRARAVGAGVDEPQLRGRGRPPSRGRGGPHGRARHPPGTRGPGRTRPHRSRRRPAGDHHGRCTVCGVSWPRPPARADRRPCGAPDAPPAGCERARHRRTPRLDRLGWRRLAGNRCGCSRGCGRQRNRLSAPGVPRCRRHLAGGRHLGPELEWRRAAAGLRLWRLVRSGEPRRRSLCPYRCRWSRDARGQHCRRPESGRALHRHGTGRVALGRGR